MGPLRPAKRTQRQYPVELKLDAVIQVRQGSTKAAVSRRTGVPEATLRGWCKDKNIHRMLQERQLLLRQNILRDVEPVPAASHAVQREIPRGTTAHGCRVEKANPKIIRAFTPKENTPKNADDGIKKVTPFDEALERGEKFAAYLNSVQEPFVTASQLNEINELIRAMKQAKIMYNSPRVKTSRKRVYAKINLE